MGLVNSSLLDAEAPRPVRPLGFKKLSDVEAEEVNWLWWPYIPAGMITLLEGDPGVGKSWITCDLAARVSRGLAFPSEGPEQRLPPQRVLMLSAEDGLGNTVRPRVEALGGDLENILVSDEPFTLSADGVDRMAAAMVKAAATIVFLDPIVAYLGGKVDMYRSNEVREVMSRLNKAARDTKCAIVLVRHLRKTAAGMKRSKGENAIYNGNGSIDFVAAVRSVMQVGEDEEGGKFVAHIKHNLSVKGDTLGFDFEGEGATGRAGVFRWTGKKQGPRGKPGNAKLGGAREFLLSALAEGPRPAGEVIAEALESEIKERTLNAAKVGLVKSVRTSEGWSWELTDHARPPSDPELEEIVEQARARMKELSHLGSAGGQG